MDQRGCDLHETIGRIRYGIIFNATINVTFDHRTTGFPTIGTTINGFSLN